MPKTKELTIPNDLGQCQEMIQRMYAQMEGMQHQLELLLRARYGRKSESFNSDQLMLFAVAGAIDSAPIAEEKAEKVDEKIRKHGRRRPSPELPRQRIVYELNAEQ